MLSLKNIIKDYATGGQSVRALDGVSIDFRRHEFVSILGPSGCGKTTLLNIIGGLDQYTSGDLEINGVSTKEYREGDWDTYRNHSVGFVFQSYNLIPHQTVLANVELALTLSGVSRAERRRRAIDALKQVGLSDQIHKKPNQLSGGQMQRVAIARALVNDPEILLADEPTGALDTQTSIQIMEILQSISKSKLIIMVTHNPDLAEQYSTRIIRLLDGKIVGDTSPIRLVRKTDENGNEVKVRRKWKNKKSMSFFTALSLSLNNLMTKKGRTFMTSFAGSIGIIGIALILSVSSGVNSYINSVQRDTLASYPIQLEAETADLSALITSIMGSNREQNTVEHEEGRIYESSVMVDLMNSINGVETNKNDLKAFKAYMEANPDLFSPYVSATQYSYNFNWRILTKDTDGKVIESDVKKLLNTLSGGTAGGMGMMGGNSMMMSNYKIWQEMLKGNNGELIHPLLKEEYDLIYGSWPAAYNEVLLVVQEDNTVSDLSLYALGLRTKDEIMRALIAASNGEMIDRSVLRSYTYEELCNLQFRLFLAAECYQPKSDGTYVDVSSTEEGGKLLYSSSVGSTLKVVGIIRPNPDATSTVLSGTIAYTSALTDYALGKTAENELLKSQIENPETDVILGLPFSDGTEPSDEEKIAAAKEYEAGLPAAERAALRRQVLAIPTDEAITEQINNLLATYSEEELNAMLQAALEEYNIPSSVLDGMDNEARMQAITNFMRSSVRDQMIEAAVAYYGAQADENILAMPVSDDQYLIMYDDYMPATVSKSTYADNLKLLGNVSKDSPESISLYANTFPEKDQIAKLIKAYNKTVEEEKQIAYTDYVALLMSSVTTIVNAISYVLIAFVAISLVVSSIMIGIITYISVLERTKEIGILRSIGASRRDIGRVFNAETLIVGFVAGAIGIIISVLLNQVINIILYHFTKIAALKAVLPIGGAIVLILISMLLTFLAGLVPSGFAARKNPVEALRTE
ncbi:MAG: ATP-binding cassette domain-containing protein [Clostridia bacterium]|nr:ATP-binding cassette domain-containing protein [Clostridia bacterium]